MAHSESPLKWIEHGITTVLLRGLWLLACDLNRRRTTWVMSVGSESQADD
ncbi:hypothetical protein [Mastigocladopsis repens]|nr:hypothetical protein [Mastigocladopsis repens]